MRSNFAKLAVLAFLSLSLISQETEARTLKNLIQLSADSGYETNLMPGSLVVLLLGGASATSPPAK